LRGTTPPRSTVPRPDAPCGPTCAALPATAPRPPRIAAPRANVGARSASAPLVTGHARPGQLNKTHPVPEKRASLLNALGSSLPAGQKRERQRRPERPHHALLHAPHALCANAVHARVVLAERRRSRKRGGETQRPRRSLSEAAVKKCGVAFSRPRVNGSGTVNRTRDRPANSQHRGRKQYQYLARAGQRSRIRQCWRIVGGRL